MKLFMYIWQRKWRIFIASVLITAIYFSGYCYNTYYSESMKLTFIYPNSEKGKYPDGTRFNIYDVLANEVMNAAVIKYNSEADNKITVSDVAGKISVRESATTNVLSKIGEARELGLDYAYFTNEYYISFNPMRRLNFNNTDDLFGLVPYVDNELFMEKFYEAYVDYFMDKHAEKNILKGFTEVLPAQDFDYLEIADGYESQINMCINYLEGKNQENGSFHSSQTGLGFNDLINSFRNLKNMQVKNLTAFVSASKLSKNPVEFVNKLKVQNELDMLEYNKHKAEAEHAQRAMSQYDHTFEENIVVAGISDENGLYQTRAQTAYDAITKRAYDAGVRAENLYQDIVENERLIKEYSSDKMSEEEYKRLATQADRMITEIERANAELVELANVTVGEYLNTKSSDYVRREVSGKSFLNVGIIIKCAAVFCGAAVLTVLVIMIADFKAVNRLKRVKKRKKSISF